MKQINYKKEAKRSLEEGVRKLNDAVSITFGPRGRNVALESFGLPKIVHDGITVAKEVQLEDKFENMGAMIVREASSKTNDVAGDGTTTAVILANAIVQEGFKSMRGGLFRKKSNPMVLRKGLEKAKDAVKEEIKRVAKKIKKREEKVQIATISAQSETIGELVAEAMEKVGDGGVITVDESKGNTIELEYKEGMQFDRGYLSPYFVTNQEKMEAVVDSPYILITDMKISSMASIVPIIEKVLQVSKSLVIISDDVETEVLANLVLNKMRGVLDIVVIKAPGFGDYKISYLEDIASVTGANVISSEIGMKLENVELENLGHADKVVSTKDTTTIVGGKGDVKSRVGLLKKQLEKEDSVYGIDRLTERIAKLSNGVAVIRVGASTEAELKELKLRVEDAVSATKAAVEEGIVPGGGITFLHAREVIKKLKLKGEEKVGADILYNALEQPIKMLLENSGVSLKELRSIRKSKDIGYNVISMRLSNMIQDGVIDPAKVLRSSLENAVSSSIMILTSDCVIVDKVEK